MCGSGPDRRRRRCQLCDWLMTLCSQRCHSTVCGRGVVYPIFFYISFSMCLTPFYSLGPSVACGWRSISESADEAPPVTPMSRLKTRDWRASGCSAYSPAPFQHVKTPPMPLCLPDVASSLFVVTRVATDADFFLFYLILFYIYSLFFLIYIYIFFFTDLKFKLNILTPEFCMSESNREIMSQMTAFILETVIYSYTESKTLFAHCIIVWSIVF